MGKTTDNLIATAKQITEQPSRRELDMLLTTGEQVSVSLMAMTLISMGVSAVSLNAWQVPMHTTSNYQNARFKRIDSERIRKELDANKIVIVTGFQGINKYEDITTLGRGGSDTTAVALAAELHADVCEIYTDVDGVYTADPRVVPNAHKMTEITYDEMLEMASLGAKVLHSRCVEIAKKYGVELLVCSSLNHNSGTIVREKTKTEKSSEDMKRQIRHARERQAERFAGTDCRFNGDIRSAQVEEYCPLGEEGQKVMEQLYRTLQLSARVYHRILKTARTIADLEDREEITGEHLLEAACYRPSETYWN